MASVYFVSQVAEPIPLLLHFIPALFLWFQVTSLPPASYTGLRMTRLRGRPRRGSPWKPRRPSPSPPTSDSEASSPRLQLYSTHASPCSPQSNSMEIVPHFPVSSPQPLNDPQAVPPHPETLHDPPSRPTAEPSQRGAPRGAGLNF
jgi:hypothetical protein